MAVAESRNNLAGSSACAPKVARMDPTTDRRRVRLAFAIRFMVIPGIAQRNSGQPGWTQAGRTVRPAREAGGAERSRWPIHLPCLRGAVRAGGRAERVDN